MESTIQNIINIDKTAKQRKQELDQALLALDAEHAVLEKEMRRKYDVALEAEIKEFESSSEADLEKKLQSIKEHGEEDRRKLNRRQDRARDELTKKLAEELILEFGG